MFSVTDNVFVETGGDVRCTTTNVLGVNVEGIYFGTKYGPEYLASDAVAHMTGAPVTKDGGLGAGYRAGTLATVVGAMGTEAA